MTVWQQRLAFLKQESAFDAGLWAYRVRADKIMVGMNGFLTMVCLTVAPLRDTWILAMLVAMPTLAMSLALVQQQSGALSTRLYMACAFMAYTALLIHQTGGDIEAHFAAFGLIGVLLYYRDWRTIAAATVFIYLQHLLVGYAQYRGWPVYVFDTSAFWPTFALHVAYFLPFVGMMAYLSVWLRIEACEQLALLAHSEHQQELLRQASIKAESANALKSQFLAHMSHEIRTPLNGVQGMLQVLQDSPLSEQQQAQVQVAQESSAHLLSILNDILDLSKIEADALELHPQPTELPALLEGLRMTFEPQAQAQGLLLKAQWDESLPEWVLVDRLRLRQILMNLLGNALKYTRAGEVCLSARAEPVLSAGSDEVMLHLQVQDTGMGFAPEMAEAIFQPFVQADNSITRAHNGAGLGLAISRKLALKMGGHLSANATLGQGACFELSVPCPVVGSGLREVPSDANQQAAAAYAAALPCAAPLHILLAEDNAVNQQVMVLLLQKLGHEVTVVGDGVQVLQALAQRRYDVLLLDVMMPVMDGLQVLQALRGDPVLPPLASEVPPTGAMCQPLPKVLMVTAQAMPEDLMCFARYGAQGVVTKPVSLAQLCQGLRDVRPVH